MLRDIGGLFVLLVMPAVLIIIMALVQDAPFRDYQDLRFSILLADEDGGRLSATVKETLIRSKSFALVEQIDGRRLSSAMLHEELRRGRYQIGLIIPKGANAEVANAANTLANSFAASLGSPPLPQRPPRDSMAIRIVFDPASRPTFRLAVRSALDKGITGASTQLLVSRINKLAGDSTAKPDVEKLLSSLGVREEQAGNHEAVSTRINSVQHNVPAWAIFGMFFIVVPLSGHIIREREEGSTLRVRLIPGAGGGVAIGRIVANTMICCLQFLLMCAVGYWLLPVFGLPALAFGNHPTALIPVVVATALCATAFGNLIGTFFRTGGQALPFGSIAIVILSALGGIWVPIELLPEVLKATAKVSPLHWSLLGMQNVILRDGHWDSIILPTAILTISAVMLWAISHWRERVKIAGL